ncbi:retrovirus-related pol polyprotein from transposon TNT 1-94 [Tanacetum coccineum]
MAVGSRDRPPMLATGRYAQWQSCFMRYVDTKPNGDALRKCILQGPYKLSSVTIIAQPATDDSLAEAIHFLLTRIGDEIYSTVDACKIAHDMWIAIERLQQGESLNKQDVKTSLFWEFGRFTSRDGESIESYYSKFYKMMNEMVRNQLEVATMQVNVQFLQQLQPEWLRFVTIIKQTVDLDKESYNKLFDILKQYQKEVNKIHAEKIAKNANPLVLVAAAQQYPDTYYQAPNPQRSYAPSSKQSFSTGSHASTRYKGKEIAKPITPTPESASKEDSDPEQAQRDKDMQKNLAFIAKYFKKIYKPTNNNLKTSSNSRNKNVDTSLRYKNDNQSRQFGNQRIVTVAGARETVGYQVVQLTRIQCFNCNKFEHFAKECKKPKRAKDYTYHKEKMLPCKQVEKVVPLQTEQADWLEDTDKEIDEQELEAHYSFMAKIQEVLPADSGTDVGPLEKVQYDDEYNLFANERHHSEQPKSINNTCVVEKVDNNVIPDLSDMCDNDDQIDQNAEECDDERVALANLISNLKLNTNENKKIQKQLKKANTSLSHGLEKCKSAFEECKSSLGESNRTRDRYLVALNDKEIELEKYKIFKNHTIENGKLESKLKDTLGLLAQKEHDIQEGLKVKAYEIFVIKEKHDELVKQSLLTKSSFEGLLKEKNKVIKDLKVKEGNDIDKMIAIEKQLKFVNEIVYKGNQSIQAIHILAHKGSMYNGRPTFANPMYLKKAQSEKPCLYEIPYDTSDLANRFTPDREETLTLDHESRSKLNKNKVKPYDYTKQNSLYENFKPPSREYLDQLARANEVRRTMWRKSFVKTKPNIVKNIDAHTKLQCLYLHKIKECECLAQKLSKQTQNVSKEVHNKLLRSFSKLEQHSISLELALQQCQEQMKNDTVCKENGSNVFLKEREQYREIQDLKAQLQDKNIAISELKKLIEKCKGKYVETKFDKPSSIRQPNAQRIPKPSVLEKPTPFLDSLERKRFSKTESVNKTNVSKGSSKPVTAHILPQNRKQAVRNTHVIKPGMYQIDTRTTQTRAPQLPQTSRNTNPRVSTSTGVNHSTSVSRPQLKSTQIKDKVVKNNSQVKFKKTEVEDHHRISSVSNKTKSVTACNDNLKSRTSNVNAVCATCGKCVFNSNHDDCVSKYINDVNARTKKPNVVPISARKPKRKANKSVATPHKKTVALDPTIQKSKSFFRELYENTNKAWKWWIEKQCPSGYKWTPKTRKK